MPSESKKPTPLDHGSSRRGHHTSHEARVADGVLKKERTVRPGHPRSDLRTQEPTQRHRVPRLDKGTKLVDDCTPIPWGSGWVKWFPEAHEALIFFRGAHDGGGSAKVGVSDGVRHDAVENRSRAQRRARSRVRLYAKANGIDRLSTLTYAPPYCTDPAQAYDDVRRFIRRLRRTIGHPLPYVWYSSCTRTASGSTFTWVSINTSPKTPCPGCGHTGSWRFAGSGRNPLRANGPRPTAQPTIWPSTWAKRSMPKPPRTRGHLRTPSVRGRAGVPATFHRAAVPLGAGGSRLVPRSGVRQRPPRTSGPQRTLRGGLVRPL
jgi:hypothetical protein